MQVWQVSTKEKRVLDGSHRPVADRCPTTGQSAMMEGISQGARNTSARPLPISLAGPRANDAVRRTPLCDGQSTTGMSEGDNFPTLALIQVRLPGYVDTLPIAIAGTV